MAVFTWVRPFFLWWGGQLSRVARCAGKMPAPQGLSHLKTAILRTGTNCAFCSVPMAIVILNEAARSEESLSGGGGEMLRCAQHDKTALSARVKYSLVIETVLCC